MVKKIILFGIVFLFTIISINFISADHLVNFSSGGKTITVNEDIANLFNISVNNSLELQNITTVNVSFWGNFDFKAGSNGTDSLWESFLNTSSVIGWRNQTSLVMNGSTQYFWFNATAFTPGTFNISVTTLRLNGTSTITNLTVTVNDTTPPFFINITEPTPTANSNLSQNYIRVNISATDNFNVSMIRIFIYFANGTLKNNTNTTTTGTFASTFLNFTNLADGTYYINATANDSNGNQNLTSETRVVTLDTTPPIIVLSSPTPNNNTIVIGTLYANVSAWDTRSISSIYVRLFNSSMQEVNSSISSSNFTANFTGLTSGATYYFNITVNDSLGNSNLTETRTIIFAQTGFQFNGTAYDSNGVKLNNTVINITISSIGGQGLSALDYYTTTSNASGWFNVTLPAFASWMYKPVIRHTNASTGAIDFVGSTVPDFPYQEFSILNNVNFYLKQAGTMNITAINSSGHNIGFYYQVKDTKLGYPVAHDFTNFVTQALVYVPADRNYSIMVYPSQSLPVSFNWNNFSVTSNYNFGAEFPTTNLSRYNATSKVVHKKFNTTNNLIRLSGYINVSGIQGWDEFKVAAILLEPGNMVYLQYGILPYNMSAWWSGNIQTDIYNLSDQNGYGYYNITVPGPAEAQTILLFASARNGTGYYGGYKNISVSYTASAAQHNFTKMYGMLGSVSNLSLNNPTSQGTTNITCKKQVLNLLNSSNGTFTNTAHIETKVDYSSYGAMEFTFMDDIAQNTGGFSIPLLNITGVKEFNVFVQQGAPKRLVKTASQIISNNNITISNFNPGDIGGAFARNQISIFMYKSNSTCDVPNPDSTCLVTSSADLSTFNPLSAVIGGGAISFRMGVNSSGILIHYVNVDMLASGPPDGAFENDAGASESSGSFSNAMKFGSAGPTIYDYVLISMPYVEGSTTTTGLNETTDVNLSIPTFYDQDANGNMNWDTPIWSSSNGTNATDLASNNSHYSAQSSAWQSLMIPTNCTTNASVINSTIPCYIDKVNNRIWIRLPHFSGTAPSATGNIVTAVSSSSSSSSGGSGGSGTSFWVNTQSVTEKQFTESYTQSLAKKYRLQVSIDKKFHYIGIVDLTTTRATINVSSKSFQAIFNIGDEKKFDLTGDGYYDVYVKLNSITNNKASITVKKINEKIVETITTSVTTAPAAETEPVPETTATPAEELKTAKSSNILLLVIGIVIVVIAGIIAYFISKKNNKKVRERIKVFY